MSKLLCLCSCLGMLAVSGAVSGAAWAADLPEGWHQDWKVATDEASENERPLFVVFSATWCGPCQAMVKNIYPQQPVRDKLESWVPVYIDVDKNKEIAAKYRVNQLPTLVYLNPDTTEINRTVGAVSSARKMIELLETKGGAKFAGGMSSLAAQGEINQLSKQIQADPGNLELRKKRFATILDQAVYQVTRENLALAAVDHRIILASDEDARRSMEEDQTFLRILSSVQRRPEFKTAYFENFEQQFPDSKRLKLVWVVSAKDSMKRADYESTTSHMKKYMARYPQGEFNAEFKLLLPQIEDFLELSKDVKFD